jgi:phosphate transport system substrate-binding protein
MAAAALRGTRIAALVALAALLASCTTGGGSDPQGSPSPQSTPGPTTTPTPTDGGDGQPSGEVRVAGDTLQAEAMAAWAAGVEQTYPGLTISFDAVGSADGLQAFLDGTADVAAVDQPVSDADATSVAERCEGDYVQIPSRLASVAVVFNVPGETELTLDAETLAGIFNQRIISWDDPAISFFNDSRVLAPTPIVPVNLTRGSGTTLDFTDYLASAGGESWPYEPSDAWPVPGGTRADSAAAAARTVRNQPGAIAYVDAGRVGNLSALTVQTAGQQTMYSAFSAQTVARESEVSETDPGVLTVALARDSTATYPIAHVSYLVACQRASEQVALNTAALLGYAVSDAGQRAAADASSSAPLPPSLGEPAAAAVELIQEN